MRGDVAVNLNADLDPVSIHLFDFVCKIVGIVVRCVDVSSVSLPAGVLVAVPTSVCEPPPDRLVDRRGEEVV